MAHTIAAILILAYATTNYCTTFTDYGNNTERVGDRGPVSPLSKCLLNHVIGRTPSGKFEAVFKNTAQCNCTEARRSHQWYIDSGQAHDVGVYVPQCDESGNWKRKQAQSEPNGPAAGFCVDENGNQVTYWKPESRENPIVC